MPRPLRIEYPGACYQVNCRGNARLPVFQLYLAAVKCRGRYLLTALSEQLGL